MSTIYNTKTRPSLRGRQSSSNSSHSSRGGSKRPPFERFSPDGVYGNSRFTHVIYSLVGCVVQVQVKNGCMYEGVFRTVSPEMNVVLELAHKIDDTRTSIPSRDRLIDKLIFGKDDVVALSAANVDLDYAVKDTFTDTAISRVNGQSFDRDRDVRELQPWDGETGDDINLIETESSSASNGWDPNDMFKTNAEQFSVRSTYDENLTQYTTQLEKKDTKEYRQREEEAARLAKEIERSDDHKARIDLENGDGDEETKFSAVVRPSEMRGPTGNGSQQKYVPPHNRRVIPPRRAASDHGGQQRQTSPSKGQQQPLGQHSQHMSTVNTSLGLKDEHIRPMNSTNINGEKDQKQNEPVLNKSSPEPSSKIAVPGSGLPQQQQQQQQQHSPVTIPDTTESPPNTNSVTPPNKGDRRNPNQRGRQSQIAELKEFHQKYKLTEEHSEKKGAEKVEEKEDESKPNIAERSKLNPMAREFVPTGQSSRCQTLPQTPTPPRPQTQSPVVQPIVPVNVPMYSHPFIVSANMMPVGPPQTAQNQGNRGYPKRAVVSVQPRSDYTAAAQHATGQPLLANATVPQQQYLPYSAVMPSVMHQQSAAGYQVMPVTANAQRMMNHNPVAASSHPNAGLDPSQGGAQQSHPQHIFMQPGHGPMPAHMTPHHGQQMSHPQPAHVGTHQVAGNPQSQGQMTPVSGPHPSPSPVQLSGPGSQQHHPQGPPQSGTPQPQLTYQQMGLQGHHQMQAPTHNPASPQATMHPVSLPYISHPHLQQGGQQFTFTQATQQPTSVSQTMHSHTHSPHMPQPQIVVMPQPPPHNQVQHSHHIQPQYQHSAAGHHLQGPTPVHGQGHHMMHHGIPTIPVSAPSGVHPSPVHHFVSSVPSHGQGGPVQTGYPQVQ